MLISEENRHRRQQRQRREGRARPQAEPPGTLTTKLNSLWAGPCPELVEGSNQLVEGSRPANRQTPPSRRMRNSGKLERTKLRSLGQKKEQPQIFTDYTEGRNGAEGQQVGTANFAKLANSRWGGRGQVRKRRPVGVSREPVPRHNSFARCVILCNQTSVSSVVNLSFGCVRLAGAAF